jgi:hypothetical protein
LARVEIAQESPLDLLDLAGEFRQCVGEEACVRVGLPTHRLESEEVLRVLEVCVWLADWLAGDACGVAIVICVGGSDLEVWEYVVIDGVSDFSG